MQKEGKNTGKGAARSLRREDMIPAVLYREGKAQSIKLARKELSKLINTISGEQVIVDLHFADGEKKLALLKDYQVDPVSRELLHTDFFEVSLTEDDQGHGPCGDCRRTDRCQEGRRYFTACSSERWK